MGIFEKYLSVWVFLAIIVGQLLGIVFPEYFEEIASFEYQNINLVITILIWAMISQALRAYQKNHRVYF